MDTQREKLFMNHFQDLSQLFGITEQIFVCPICLNIFDENSIQEKAVSIGHVWPEYIRKGNRRASEQQVLLCTDCNSSAGSNADASMQEFEKLNDARKTGTFVVPPRKAQIISTNNPDNRPIRTTLFIEPKGENTITFFLDTPNSSKQRKNNKEIAKQIMNYLSMGPISIISTPPINFDLARVGWLTSAYLLSFYTFGYRYILQESLDIVRKQIQQSFERITDNSLAYSEDKTMLVARWDTNICDEPRIAIFIPYNRDKEPYIFLDFRDIHVRMPVRFHYTIEWQTESTPGDLDRNFVIDGSAHKPHTGYCHWEEGFGEPEYRIINN